MSWWPDIMVWTAGLSVAGFAYLAVAWLSRRVDDGENDAGR